MIEIVKSSRRVLVLALVVGLLLLGWIHGTTFFSIADKWDSDAAYGHGYLILPIVLWLLWLKRKELKWVAFKPSWFGVLAIVACTMLWIVAHGIGALVIEQFAVVAMISALVLAILGWPATRTIIFPLGFLFFAVPFGRGIVPWLMQLTADLSTIALQWSGVPVLRSHMFISIPGGNFEVAKACSGLKFFVAGLVLGTLYAHLTYRTWRKRALCVAAFVVIPILLNSARVYITILVSYLTDMRFGPGQEHVTFGIIFFSVVMLVMFWIGRRWHDDVPDQATVSISPLVPSAPPLAAWTAVIVAFGAVVIGPFILESSVAQARVNLADVGSLARMPSAGEGWRGPEDVADGWRPQYHGGLVERQAVYVASDSVAVDVFVSVYGLGTTNGAEMISYNNVIDLDERSSLTRMQIVRVPLDGADSLTVRERTVEHEGVNRLVWQWYVVGDRPVVNQFAAKALEALAFMSRGANSERIITLSTIDDVNSRERLASFVVAHTQCVARGFAAEVCGE